MHGLLQPRSEGPTLAFHPFIVTKSQALPCESRGEATAWSPEAFHLLIEQRGSFSLGSSRSVAGQFQTQGQLRRTWSPETVTMETVTVTYTHLLRKGLKMERTMSSKPLPSTLNPFTIVFQPLNAHPTPHGCVWMLQPSLYSQKTD